MTKLKGFLLKGPVKLDSNLRTKAIEQAKEAAKFFKDVWDLLSFFDYDCQKTRRVLDQQGLPKRFETYDTFTLHRMAHVVAEQSQLSINDIFNILVEFWEKGINSLDSVRYVDNENVIVFVGSCNEDYAKGFGYKLLTIANAYGWLDLFNIKGIV